MTFLRRAKDVLKTSVSAGKDRDSFPPFQQGVHPLPELEKFLFSLNYLKR